MRNGTHHAALPLSSTMCCPAIRLMYVQAAVDDDEVWVNIYDVVALRNSIEADCHHSYRARAVPTIEGMAEAGWSVDVPFSYLEGVIVTDEGLVTTRDEELHASNAVGEIVVCPWPREEDETRLRPIIDKLIAAAKDRVKHRVAARVAAQKKAAQQTKPAVEDETGPIVVHAREAPVKPTATRRADR
jgi:hypothetical protein